MRLVTAVVASAIYWIVSGGLWALFFFADVVGDCVGPQQEACIADDAGDVRGLLLALLVLVPVYVVGLWLLLRLDKKPR